MKFKVGDQVSIFCKSYTIKKILEDKEKNKYYYMVSDNCQNEIVKDWCEVVDHLGHKEGEITMKDIQYESEDKMVSHPSHYQSANGMEVIDVIKSFTSDLKGIEAVCTANAIKYICRWKHKNGIQDLEKAIWYLTYLVNSLKEK